jgi:predicted KAP-like P-loop ATPase
VISTSVASGLVGKLAEIVGHHNKSIEEIKNEICENQIKYDGRIIIVIDDIDRLNEIEIKQIFQLVKSIADFPNTTYVLTFDREVVSKALETEQCGNGNQYLEKIVQIPFELPEISRSELISLLDTQILKIIVRNPHDDFYEKAYIEMLNRGFYHFFNNIRDINRYINVANFNYEVLKEEVNVIDFIGITAIQVFLPELYQEIKSNRHVFLSTKVSSNSQNDSDKAICVEILNRYDIKRRNILQNFLTMLFPKLSSFYENTTHSSEAYVLWRKNRRICSEYFFNVYFRFAVSETKISQAEMKILLSKGNDVVTILESIQNIIKDGKGSDFLISLLDKTDIIPVEDIESFVTAIFVVGDSLEETSTDSFYIHEIISSLLKKVESQKERYNILKKSTNYANNSLYIVAKEVASLENDENELISYEDLHELKQLTCNRFSACLKEGKLIHSPHFYHILQFMGKWRAKDELENYMKLIALDDDALLLLITNIMEHHAIQPIDFTQKNWGNWVQLVISLNQLIEVSYIKERLIEIKESANYVDLNENMKVALEAFLNGIEVAYAHLKPQNKSS